MRMHHPRITVRRMLLVVAFVAMVAALVAERRCSEELRAQRDQARAELSGVRAGRMRSEIHERLQARRPATVRLINDEAPTAP